ncbi:hypothetical protein LCGC14_2180500 [marine sediment metagenome]|uniref:Uncharacterized protein n=1 Tax=marine sediment metagenome TaxID=412755 RepID=A0A0F9E9K3_9ZZZZ
MDEIREATLNEFDLRVEIAKETFKEREAQLKNEGAASADFVLLEKAHGLELKQISDDRLADNKEKADKIKEIWADYWKAVITKEKEFVSFKEGIKDKIDQLTLDEFELKEKVAREGYEAQLKFLEANFKDSILYAELKKGIELGYSLERAKIEADRAASLRDTEEKELGESKRIMEERLSTWRGIARDMGSVFGRFATDLLDTNTTLMEDLKNAWDGMKRIFFQIVEDMIAKWITGFINKIISSIAEKVIPALISVESQAIITGTAVSGIGAAAEGAAATTAVSAASIVAALGPVLAILGVVIAGVFAFSKILPGLFIKVPKGFRPSLSPGVGGGGDPDIVGKDPSGTDISQEERLEIGDIPGLAAIVPGFAQGVAFVPKMPTAIRVDPRELVDITPLNELSSTGQSRAGLGAGEDRGGNNITVNIYAQKLDDTTINEAKEKIFNALEWEARRKGAVNA